MAHTALLVLLPILMLDGVIEVGFVGSMVGFLHDRAGRTFTIDGPQGTFELNGKPAGVIANQGHTSNGAAGTAVVLVGIIGLLTIWWERRRARMNPLARRPSTVFTVWTVFTILSALLTLSAIIYTFIVTNQTDNQSINISVAAQNVGKPYPGLKWTPENWFDAVLALPLASQSDRNNIETHVKLMRGWRWNLIPLLLLGVSVCAVAVMDVIKGKKEDSVRRNRDSNGVSLITEKQAV